MEYSIFRRIKERWRSSQNRLRESRTIEGKPEGCGVLEAKRLSFKKGVANFIENCQNTSRKIITEIISSNMEF